MGMSARMRLLGNRNWLGNTRWALALACVALLAFTATASAADRYTQPGGVTTGSCDSSNPCDLEYAVESVAQPGDAVIVTGLTYTVSSPIVASGSITVRGAGTPRPQIRGAAGLAGPTLTVNNGAAVTNLRITSQTSSVALDLNGIGTKLEVFSTAGDALRLRGSSDLNTAAVHTSAAGATAVVVSDGLLTGATIRHATIVATGTGSTGIDPSGLGLLGIGSPSMSDSIVGGNATDIGGGGLISVGVNVEYSTYRNGLSTGAISGGGNWNSAPPVVDAAGLNFQQQPGAVTVDAGANADGASQDLAGKPRVSDGAPDIGAYELPVPPDVTTGGTSSVTATGATLGATVNPRSTATDYSFVWGTANPPATNTPTRAAGSGATGSAASEAITGLKPGTTYYYRAVATSTWGTTQGLVQSFTTPSIAPVGVTDPATGVAATGATLKATVNPGGAATSVKFEWGDDTTYGNSTANTATSGPDNVTVSRALTGLLPGRTYHYRVVADNLNGTVNGADQTFTTPSVAPAVANLSSSGATTTSVTLNGEINPGGALTAWAFSYGIGGYTTDVDGADLTGAAALSVQTTLSGLQPGTTYDYKLAASNTNGGQQLTGQFTTVVAAPTATTNSLNQGAIRVDNATLSGRANPGGSATGRYRFEYGATDQYGQVTGWTNLPDSASQSTVTADVSGLQAATAYHFRIVVENEVTTAVGADQVFTTREAPPSNNPGGTSTATSTGSTSTDGGSDDGADDATDDAPGYDGPVQADGLPAPALVPPVGRSTNATPASGTIRVRLPGADEFVELTEGAGIPVGSIVDATQGEVTITSAKDTRGTTQSADFTGAQFKVTQKRAAQPITDITLTGGSFSDCTPRILSKVGDVNAAGRRKWSRRRLWGNGHGRFRTRGRHGTATVRGTWWLTEDRCDGTLVRVRRGLVEVRDLERRRTVMVPAGKSYLAKSLQVKKRRARKLR